MKTKNFKTLRGLLLATDHGQINFNDFNNRCFWDKNTHLWTRFNLPEDEIKTGYILLSSRVYCRKHEEKARFLSWYAGPKYGILNRLSLELGTDKKTIYGCYCAGQDGETERRILQGIFRKGR